tara:strand:+ start:320 stop:532 length:213 start_codon:yes stop_codon:yes gene_type:complete
MRKVGDKTHKICWNLSIFINNKTFYEKDFSTLKDVAAELDLSYNVVSEMALGRKKNRKGRYETQYLFTKL